MRVRALLSGPAITLVGGLLAGRLLWTGAVKPYGPQIYGLVIGLMLGLLAWVLSYWPLSTLAGGTLLFLFFYVTVGLIQQYLHGNFGRQVVLEYVGLALIALFVIFLGLD